MYFEDPALGCSVLGPHRDSALMGTNVLLCVAVPLNLIIAVLSLRRVWQNVQKKKKKKTRNSSKKKSLLTIFDWLNILNYYKMLLDGFKRANWEEDSVREQVASTMIKKTKEFFESNYPDLIEVKKIPIFDKDDFK